MSEFKVTERTKVKRGHKRASYDKDQINAIIDEAMICHIGAQTSMGPMVQPTAIWRIKDKVYIHGSRKNGLYQTLLDEVDACITITLLDGLVLARSSMHHSFNYRSVMIFGKAKLVEGDEKKTKILDALMEKITPDRVKDIRGPNEKELFATTVLEFDLEEVSAKIRTGKPVDDHEDYALDVWAGVIPLKLMRDIPIKDTSTEP